MNKNEWLTKSQLQSELLSRDEKILLFVADWCGYCRRFLSVLSSSKQLQSSKMKIVDVDSEDGSLWDQYGINLVPTLIVFKDGKEIFRRGARPMVGLVQKDMEDAISAK
jgi:thioredoxin 1